MAHSNALRECDAPLFHFIIFAHHDEDSPVPFFSAAAVLALTVPLSALADYPDLPPEPPRAASSFIGMGAATGTPSGDVAQAVKPVCARFLCRQWYSRRLLIKAIFMRCR